MPSSVHLTKPPKHLDDVDEGAVNSLMDNGDGSLMPRNDSIPPTLQSTSDLSSDEICGDTPRSEKVEFEIERSRMSLELAKVGNQDRTSEMKHASQFSVFTSDDSANQGPYVSFLDMVRKTVSKKGDDVFATWYGRDGEPKNEYTFGGLWEEAGVIADCLRNKWHLQKGDRVVLCYNLGLHFFASFLGCLRAGVTAVLVYPPIPPLSQSLPKMNKVIGDCGAKVILIDTDIEYLKMADKWNPFSKSSQLWPDDGLYQVTSKLRAKIAQKPVEFDEVTSPGDLAFLQYTSGSTGDPKGVMITFGALAGNVKMIVEGFRKAVSGRERGNSKRPKRFLLAAPVS